MSILQGIRDYAIIYSVVMTFYASAAFHRVNELTKRVDKLDGGAKR